MKTSSFPKAERLSSKKTIATLFESGQSGFIYPFRYLLTSTEDTQQDEGTNNGSAAILISVSKRYHKRANKRNTIKRRTREAYRLSKSQFVDHVTKSGKHVNIALLYSSKEEVTFNVISNAVKKIITEISKRC